MQVRVPEERMGKQELSLRGTRDPAKPRVHCRKRSGGTLSRIEKSLLKTERKKGLVVYARGEGASRDVGR